MAADAITVPLSSTAEIPIGDSSGFDWTGFYAGVFAGLQSSPAGGDQVALGVNAGVNAQFDFYLLGAEVAVRGLTGGVGESTYGQLLGRAGLIASDDVMIYAAGGYGIDLGPPAEQDALLGGGIEYAVTDSVSLRAEYVHGFPLEGGNPKDQITFGANFHF
ncbi:MAG: porin family protein [Devosia sp.]|uniref:outer membrane protein n=1 Tax=Devosia sp. TaxID=1871048 RepID=UPI0024C5A595|nr:porin family protein [Devosia sp.]UYO00298.1 MAG: porin family protein [Devosia sp.]